MHSTTILAITATILVCIQAHRNWLMIQAAKRVRWEYKTVNLPLNANYHPKILNESGSYGWEIIHWGKSFVLLKRKI